MEKREKIEKLAQDKDEAMLLARVYDRITPAATAFLSPREQVLTGQLLRGMPLHFFGGCEQAERKMCLWLPDYLDESWLSSGDGPCAAVRAEFFAHDRLTHRDFLGALMGCGIRREAVGDLCLQPRQCDLFVTAELAPYLLDNLTSAGRAHLTLTRIAPSQADRPPQTLQELRVTVSSPRLDSVISAAFHLSRGSAADAVAAGRVNLNDLPCLKPDRAVQENDTVSVRGLGKLRVLALGGLTKKGRLALTLGKYL